MPKNSNPSSPAISERARACSLLKSIVPFVQYLEALERTATVGMAGSPCNCPIVLFLRSHGIESTVSANGRVLGAGGIIAGSIWDEEFEEGGLSLDDVPWLCDFVRAIDGRLLKDQPVTAEVALSVAKQLNEGVYPSDLMFPVYVPL